jgi:mxaJ protein
MAISAQAGILKVCADPNNLPFSNRQGDGFENKLAQIIAGDLGDSVKYTWWAQRRGYVRNTIKAGHCDAWLGVATGVDMLATTRPYYRSSYVFVTRKDRSLIIRSMDDPRLRTLRIGVQMVGDDAVNTPPAHALARRGIVDNVRGYMVYGDYSRPNPERAILDDVENGQLDVAMVWGPVAGYFAAFEPSPLAITPIEPPVDDGVWPMEFDVSVGVKHGDPELKHMIQKALDRHQRDIMILLTSYRVPQLPIGASEADAPPTRK